MYIVNVVITVSIWSHQKCKKKKKMGSSRRLIPPFVKRCHSATWTNPLSMHFLRQCVPSCVAVVFEEGFFPILKCSLLQQFSEGKKISHLNWYCCTYKNCIKSASGSPVHVKNGGHSNGEAGGFNYHFCKWNISKTLQNFRCSNVFGFFECFVWIFTSTAKDVSCWELCTTLHKTGERKNWTKKFYRDKSNSGQFSQNEKTRTLLINSRERGYGNCHSAKAILSLILCFDDIIPQKVQLMIH